MITPLNAVTSNRVVPPSLGISVYFSKESGIESITLESQLFCCPKIADKCPGHLSLSIHTYKDICKEVNNHLPQSVMMFVEVAETSCNQANIAIFL